MCFTGAYLYWTHGVNFSNVNENNKVKPQSDRQLNITKCITMVLIVWSTEIVNILLFQFFYVVL